MADINKFSEQINDLAERLANVADAAKGKDTKTMRPKARWVLLPAAGAGIYALTSRAYTRQGKSLVDEAKARASDLLDELVSRMDEATGSPNNRSNHRKSPRTKSSRSGGRRRRKGSANR
jgi:hypothetical protein